MAEMVLRQKKPQSVSKNNHRPKSNSEIQMLIETRRNNMEAEKMEESLLKENNAVNETDFSNGIKKNDTSKQSKIPVPIKEKSKKPENLEESTIEKQRQKGAIRKQPKNHQNFRQKKPNIPTKINHKSFSSPQPTEKQTEYESDKRFSNISSGDIIDDVLYISTPIKPQNLAGSKCDNNQTICPPVISNHTSESHLQGFELIAPDSFYGIIPDKSLPVTNDIDTAKPSVKNVSSSDKLDETKRALNNDKAKDVLSETQDNQNKINDKHVNTSHSSLKQHSLEEVDSSAIRNGNRAFVPNDARSINHGQSSRSNGRPFHSGMVGVA